MGTRLCLEGLGRSQQGVVQRSLGIGGIKTAKHRVHREGEVRGRVAHLQGSQATGVVQDTRQTGIWGHLSTGSGLGARPPDSEEGVDMGKAELHLRGWNTRRSTRSVSWTEYKVGAHYQNY